MSKSGTKGMNQQLPPSVPASKTMSKKYSAIAGSSTNNQKLNIKIFGSKMNEKTNRVVKLNRTNTNNLAATSGKRGTVNKNVSMNSKAPQG